MSDRPSLRHGLPYGWWRHQTVQTVAAGVTLAVTLGASLAVFTLVIIAYVFGIN